MNIIKNLFQNFFDTNQKVSFCFLLLLMLMSSILEIIGISFIIPLISSFLNSETVSNENINKFFNYFKILDFNSIYNLLAIFLFIFFIKFIFLIYFYYYQTKFIYNFKEKLSNKLFFNYLNKKYSLVKKNSSTLLSNVINEVDFVTNYLDSLSKLFLDIIIVFFLSVFLLYYNFYVSISIIVILLTFLLIYFTFFKDKIKMWGYQRFESTNKRIQYLTEGIKGNKTIKIFSSENYFYEKFLEFNKIFKQISIKINFLANMPKVLLEFLGIISMLSVIVYALKSNYDQNYIIELLGVFLFAFFKIVPSLNRIIGNLQNMRYFNFSVDLILKEKTTYDFSKDSGEKMLFQNEILVKIKNFIFENEENTNLNENYLIKNINLIIKKNDKIGIIGPSGSGKSTFLDIFSGLLALKDKAIVVDGNPINDNVHGWQKNIGFVPQKTFIIEDTLRNNILFGYNTDKVDENNLQSILSKANLNKLIQRLPSGLDTIVKEDGINFSGGEIQRIGIARALIRQPKIIILDEATSALDIENEKEIIQDLIKIKDITIISVTHRLSALIGFDRIYSLESGNLTLA